MSTQESKDGGAGAGLALVATDGTEAAIEAAKQALSLLNPDLEHHLVTIVSPEYDPNEDAGGFAGPVMSQEQAADEHAEVLSDAADALAATAHASDATNRSEIITSPLRPADALVELAAERNAAVLVVGHEQVGIIRAMFGDSVAERVMRRAPCPVLIVPFAD